MIRGQWQVPNSPYLFEGLNDDVVENIMHNLSGREQLAVKRVNRATRDRLHGLPFLEMNWMPLLKKLEKLPFERPKNRMRQALDVALGRPARFCQLNLHRYGLAPAVLNKNDCLARAMHAIDRNAECASFLPCAVFSGVSSGLDLPRISRAELSWLDIACAYLQVRCPRIGLLSLVFRGEGVVPLSQGLSGISRLEELLLIDWLIPPLSGEGDPLKSSDETGVGSAQAQEMQSDLAPSPPLPKLRALVLVGRHSDIDGVGRLLPYFPGLRRLVIEPDFIVPPVALHLSTLSELRYLHIPSLPLLASASNFTLPAILKRLDLYFLANYPDVDFGSLMPRSLRELTIRFIEADTFPSALYTLSQLTFLSLGGKSFSLTPERVDLPNLKTLAIGSCEMNNETCSDVHFLVDQITQLRSLFLVGLTRLKTATLDPQRHASLEHVATYKIPSLVEGDLELLKACPNAKITEHTKSSGLKKQIFDEHSNYSRDVYGP